MFFGMIYIILYNNDKTHFKINNENPRPSGLKFVFHLVKRCKLESVTCQVSKFF